MAFYLTLASALVIFAVATFDSARASAAATPAAPDALSTAPFEFGFAGKPGKGDTSFSDAVSRIEVRLYNRSKEKQIIRRNEHRIDDVGFNLASTVTLLNSKGQPIKAEDHRAEMDMRMPETEKADVQIIEPGGNAFLTSLVIRKPKPHHRSRSARATRRSRASGLGPTRCDSRGGQATTAASS